jgi:hypothetical protein
MAHNLLTYMNVESAGQRLPLTAVERRTERLSDIQSSQISPTERSRRNGAAVHLLTHDVEGTRAVCALTDILGRATLGRDPYLLPGRVPRAAASRVRRSETGVRTEASSRSASS